MAQVFNQKKTCQPLALSLPMLLLTDSSCGTNHLFKEACHAAWTGMVGEPVTLMASKPTEAGAVECWQQSLMSQVLECWEAGV